MITDSEDQPSSGSSRIGINSDPSSVISIIFPWTESFNMHAIFSLCTQIATTCNHSCRFGPQKDLSISFARDGKMYV